MKFKKYVRNVVVASIIFYVGACGQSTVFTEGPAQGGSSSGSSHPYEIKSFVASAKPSEGLWEKYHVHLEWNVVGEKPTKWEIWQDDDQFVASLDPLESQFDILNTSHDVTHTYKLFALNDERTKYEVGSFELEVPTDIVVKKDEIYVFKRPARLYKRMLLENATSIEFRTEDSQELRFDFDLIHTKGNNDIYLINDGKHLEAKNRTVILTSRKVKGFPFKLHLKGRAGHDAVVPKEHAIELNNKAFSAYEKVRHTHLDKISALQSEIALLKEELKKKIETEKKVGITGLIIPKIGKDGEVDFEEAREKIIQAMRDEYQKKISKVEAKLSPLNTERQKIIKEPAIEYRRYLSLLDEVKALLLKKPAYPQIPENGNPTPKTIISILEGNRNIVSSVEFSPGEGGHYIPQGYNYPATSQKGIENEYVIQVQDRVIGQKELLDQIKEP